ATASLNQPEMAVHGLLQRMNVETICTTDDPIDDLSHHRAYSEKPANFQMFPAFRPDKAMSVENSVTFNAYVDKLEQCSNSEIRNFKQYVDALKSRHDSFAEQGCCISDHGLSHLEAA